MQGSGGVLARLKAAPLHIRLLIAFGLVLALGAAQSMFAYRTAADNVDADAAQYRIEETANVGGETRIALLQMEAGYRGYLLTGDDGLLASYRQSALTFNAKLATLLVLSSDDRDEMGRWQTLQRRVAVWQQDILEPGIALRQVATVAEPKAAGLANAALSQQDIDGIHRLLDKEIAEEQAELFQSHLATIDANNRLMAVLLWGTLAVLGVGLAVAWVAARNLARAMAQVQAGQRRYHQMFANNSAIKLLIDSISGAIVEANQAACAFYGYSRADLLRLRLTDISMLPTDQVAENMSSVATGLRSSFVFNHRLASGDVRDVEVQSSRVDDVDGAVLLYCIIHDITERKQAEAALRTSEEQFRKQYKGFPLPTCSWLQVPEGDDFVFRDYNDAAEVSTNGAVCDWFGSRASVRFVDYPEILADLQTCASEQRTLRRETSYRNKYTGPARQLAFSYVFVPPRTVMVHTEDITATKQADQQREAMAQSEKLRALGQMATGIAHDLNQSLMLVASYSDLARQALVQNPPNLAELEDLMTTTTQAALDGGETVKRLLLFTRAAPEQDSKRVDLSSVVHEAAQLTAPRWRDAAQAERRPISLHVEAHGHPTILGSAARLRELLTNLIFNAVDALPTGGTIRLRVVAEGGQGIIEVVDSGLGMSAEVQARVFEPFFTTKGESGTGLGLAMVFGIVEQHGGQITVRSAPGDGTTFRITLPLVDASVAAEPAPKSAVRLGPPRALRVLAVDDEPMMTKAVVRMLKPSGHLVSVAASGEEALQKLAEQTFDVVVSDMGMGAGMDGWELADQVKSRWPNVRFLLATGWGAAMDPGEARTRGIEAVLSKPYHPVELLQALAQTDAAA
jgi:PAS domain S-box-containing protein